MIEIKTCSAVSNIDALYRQSINGNKWIECSSVTSEFKLAVPDPAYRSQLCQHCTALGLKCVLIVFGVPGGLPKMMVLVSVSEEHRYNMFTLQQIVAEKYTPFCWWNII